jgi:type I site-specific restriction endonuclease
MKPEQKARHQIDVLLDAAGWTVQDLDQLNLGETKGIAVREFPLKSGPAACRCSYIYYNFNSFYFYYGIIIIIM